MAEPKASTARPGPTLITTGLEKMVPNRSPEPKIVLAMSPATTTKKARNHGLNRLEPGRRFERPTCSLRVSISGDSVRWHVEIWRQYSSFAGAVFRVGALNPSNGVGAAKWSPLGPLSMDSKSTVKSKEVSNGCLLVRDGGRPELLTSSEQIS